MYAGGACAAGGSCSAHGACSVGGHCAPGGDCVTEDDPNTILEAAQRFFASCEDERNSYDEKLTNFCDELYEKLLGPRHIVFKNHLKNTFHKHCPFHKKL